MGPFNLLEDETNNENKGNSYVWQEAKGKWLKKGDTTKNLPCPWKWNTPSSESDQNTKERE